MLAAAFSWLSCNSEESYCFSFKRINCFWAKFHFLEETSKKSSASLFS